MINIPSLKVIYESDRHSFREWMQIFNIREDEFLHLVSEGILTQYEKESYRNTFVGTIKFKQSIFYSLPKCFTANAGTDTKSLKYIVNLTEKSLLKYNSRIRGNQSIIESENYFLISRHLINHTEFDLYITLKDSYLRNGLFRKSQDLVKRQQTYTRVAWHSTINKTHPVFSDGTPLYLNPISKNNSYTENYVTLVHYSVLNYLTKKFQFFDYGNNLTPLLLAERSELIDELDLKLNADGFIALLKSELSISFRDDTKALLMLLIEFFEIIGNRSKKTWSFFGTSYFHNIWEDALKLVLNDESEFFMQQMAQPVYKINGVNYYDSRQEPDILKEVNNQFYVMDAKYYVIDFSRPGWKDIVKQFFYRRSLVPKKPYSRVENVFLVPVLTSIQETHFNDSHKHIGYVYMEHNGEIQKEFDPIQIVGFNPITIFNHYINNQLLGIDLYSLINTSPEPGLALV